MLQVPNNYEKNYIQYKMGIMFATSSEAILRNMVPVKVNKEEQIQIVVENPEDDEVCIKINEENMEPKSKLVTKPRK